MRRSAALLLVLAASGCVRHRPPPPALVASPHYFLGDAYKAGGLWYYPAETYSLDTTGIASVAAPHDGLTADGELPDPTALTAAMQTIQLPAIVTVTNLENGRQVEVRVNDRGPANPARIIAVSPRAATLLAMPANGSVRVRVQIDELLSRRLVDQLGGGPKLAIAAAPKATVSEEALPPLGSSQKAAPARTLGAQAAETTGPLVPNRLPETIHQTYADPGQLWLRAGSFGRFTYANQVAAKLAGLGGDVLQSRDGRQTTYAVRAGPFRSIAQADAAEAEAVGRGVIDARITVE